MKPWIILLAFVCAPLFAKTAARYVAEIEQAILEDDSRMTNLSSLVDQALDGALDRAIKELRKKGYGLEAYTIEKEWEVLYKRSAFIPYTGIGDHKPVSQWLADTYNTIEFILGIDLCISLHIADIKTINFAIPVVFKPCSFPMDSVQGERKTEYKRHFCGWKKGDDKYFGLVPVVSYWAINIGCIAGTFGSGFGWLCSPVANVGERLMAHFVAPGLSDRIYANRCEKGDPNELYLGTY